MMARLRRGLLDPARAFTAQWQVPGDTGGTALTGYHVIMRANSAAWPPDRQATKVGATTRSYTFSGLSPNRIYWFKVKACNGANQTRCSRWSSQASVTLPIDNPGTPRWGSFSADATQIRVTWSAPSYTGGVGLTGYGLRHWRVGASEPSSAQVTVNAQTTSRTFSGLASDTSYRFSIQACNGPNRCSGWINKDGRTDRAPTAAPPDAPNRVGRPGVSARDAALHVDWDAPGDGGSAITHYDVRHRAGTSGAWTEREVSSGTSTTIPGLMNGTSYQVQVRASNAAGDGDWSATATGTPTPTTTPAVPRPQNLNLTPLGNRLAHLTWTWPGADETQPGEYRVSIRPYGLEDNDVRNQWRQIQLGQLSGSGKDRFRTVILDSFFSTAVRNFGLADYQAYELRVRGATEPEDETGGTATYTPYSDSIVVIDTPITHATAFNASSPSQVNVLQKPLHTILNDTSYQQGDFEFRYRRIGHDKYPHTALLWSPNSYTPVDLQANWELSEVYGVQVVFRPSNTAKPTVYAARDAYVWPSSQDPGLRDRVASFPYGHDAVDDRTYTYRICNYTLPQPNRMDWHRFIRHAMGHWGSVTSGRIQADYEAGACADYTRFIERAVEIALGLYPVIGPADPVPPEVQQQIRDEIQAEIDGMFKSLADMGYNYGKVGETNRGLNEVRLTNVGDTSFLVRAGAFPQLSAYFGLHNCGFTGLGCATVSPGHADIFINHIRFSIASLDLPSGFRFDRCLDSSGVPMEEDVDVRLYRTLVHEATHTFGINYPARYSWEVVTQRMHHPNGELSSVMASGAGLCGPTQLDLLAVHAKYQSQYP